jgi:hypothetical protein
MIMSIKKSLVLLGTIILLAIILVACGGKPEPTSVPTAAPTEEVKPTIEVPYQALWEGSAHNNVSDEPFRHWDDATANPDGVPTTCAKCHTTAGYQDFLGVDGSEAGKVDAAVPAANSQGIQCVACHNPVTLSKTTVVFPSGVEVTAGDDSRCMECHQGRESKVSVDEKIAKFGENLDPDKVPASYKDDAGKDVTLGFSNVHYYAAAATLYGSVAHGGYEYDGLIYDAKNTHVEGLATCTGCHDQHTLKVKVDKCAECHEGVTTVEDLKKVRMLSSARDYDGDGNVTEGISEEISGLQEILLAEIQKYATAKAGADIQYDGATYPYFMGADGKAYASWTPRLLKAAYNYQVSLKDPGAFAHNPKYIIELLHDSIADLSGDVTKLAREDAGHFAGNTLPFRDWDENATGVPFGCVKCHTAQGFPTFLTNGGSVVVTGTGSTVTTGLANMPPSNGFMCSTCHDTANFPNRLAVASVTFPSGKTVSLGGKDADGKFLADDSNICISCHQGRESTTSMNNALKGKEDDTVDAKISFKNIHYLGAGATLFGGDVQGAYQFADKQYVGQNMHADPKGAMNKCKDCHEVHALEVKVETCKTCHGDAKPDDIRKSEVDFDGDGDVTEGIKGEIATLSDALYAEIQKYAEATSQPVVYDTASYPYFFLDADKDGKPDTDAKGATVAYTGNWTPKLVRAAYNYQYVQKDPGAFVHNPKYVIQFLIDSIEDLSGDISKYTRPEVPAAQ